MPRPTGTLVPTGASTDEDGPLARLRFFCLVSAVGSRIANNAFTLDLGWNYTENVASEDRDEVEDVAYFGQDYVWDYFEKVTDRDNNQIAWKIFASYVHRVRRYADLTTIGIQPPG